MKRFVKVLLMCAVAIATGVGVVWAATHNLAIVTIDGSGSNTSIQFGQPKKPDGSSGGLSKIVAIDDWQTDGGYVGINANQVALKSIAYPGASVGARIEINDGHRPKARLLGSNGQMTCDGRLSSATLSRGYCQHLHTGTPCT